jgi:hypothetical protein
LKLREVIREPQDPSGKLHRMGSIATSEQP